MTTRWLEQSCYRGILTFVWWWIGFLVFFWLMSQLQIIVSKNTRFCLLLISFGCYDVVCLLLDSRLPHPISPCFLGPKSTWVY